MEYKGVKVYNPHHPRCYFDGGKIYKKANMSKEQLNNDSVLGILKPGEVVIPTHYKGRPLANQIIKYLKSKNIYLPHF